MVSPQEDALWHSQKRSTAPPTPTDWAYHAILPVAPHSLAYSISFSDRHRLPFIAVLIPVDVFSQEILVLTTCSNVLVSLCVLPCSFLPPSSYAIVGYDTVKDAELAADEHSSAVLDNYQLAVFSYPSLQQSNAGTAFEYHRNTEMFSNLGIYCSQWTHCT